MRKHVYTIKAEDVYKPFLRVHGMTIPLTNLLGRILPRDVGKRIYLVDRIYQVENDEQLAARQAESQKDKV